MNKKKLFAAVVLSLVLAVLLSFTASAETTEAHWILNPDGTYSYMDEDGELVKHVLSYWIDGDYYGFDASGIMYTGWVQPYKLEIYSSKETRETWYYYGPDGRAPDWGYDANTGYMFDGGGGVMPYTVTYSEGVLYASDRSGAATVVTGTGWQMLDGKWFYVSIDAWGNYEIYSDIATIGGVEYYFQDGFLLADEWCWHYDPETEDEGYIYVDAGGHPIYEGWVKCDGKWYYIQDGYRLEDGIYTIGQNKYYFDWNGALRENGYVYYDYTYYASNGGALLCNQWRQVGSAWTYFDENGHLVEDRAYTIGGTVYYFDYEGEMVTNARRYVPEYGCHYWFGANGAGTEIADGWFKTLEGKWMYFKYGGYYSDCVVNIGGTDYAFDYEGYLYDEVDWGYFEDFEYGGYEAYAINADGTVNKTPGWVNINGDWGYIQDGVLVYDWYYVGDTWYYFQPTMAVNTTVFSGDKCYYFFSDGSYVEVTGNGLYRYDSYTTLYLENNVPAYGWRQINGEWYYFDYDMYVDGIYEIDGCRYYFDENGVMQAGGWIDRGSDWYYADASGRLYTGPQNIGGTTYFFNDFGRLSTGGRDNYWNGVRYLTNASGAVIAKNTDATGWYYDNGNYYYLDNGYFCYADDTYQIGDKYYGFDYNGVMIANKFDDGRYYKADGSMHTDGWLFADGYWYYTEEYNDGWLYSGLNQIGGKYYYFYNYRLVIGTFVYDYEIITTDASGAVNNIQPCAEGWNLVNDNGNGYYYYVQNGELYTGWLGDYYLDPSMLCGDYYEIDGKYYYFYDNGVYARNGWIQYIDGDWLYAKADGSLCRDEWLQSGSAWYYFDNVWMAYGGEYRIDGKNHKFDNNGVWLGEVSETEETKYSNGWHYIYETYEYDAGKTYTEEGWKYYQGGYPISYDIAKIDGVWYAFRWDGFMLANSFSEEGYYCGANGAIIDYTGWQMIDGRWCYFTIENKAATGWFVVGGTKYYAEMTYVDDENGLFEKYSIGIATGYKYIDGKLYNFASGGACLGEVTTDGWYYADEEWYYVQNGELVRDDVVSIGGVRYAFDYSGRMVYDAIVYDYDADRYILLGKNGAQITSGWYLLENEWYGNHWYYIDSQGYVLTGTHIINGVSYYFNIYEYYF